MSVAIVKLAPRGAIALIAMSASVCLKIREKKPQIAIELYSIKENQAHGT
jgi:hypothetical protein